jgi:hypothetical protein
MMVTWLRNRRDCGEDDESVVMVTWLWCCRRGCSGDNVAVIMAMRLILGGCGDGAVAVVMALWLW